MRIGEAKMHRRLTFVLVIGLFLLGCVTATPALAMPWWHVSSETAPTNLPPGGKGQLLIVVSNLGDAPIDGAEETVLITDKLPPGLLATGIAGPSKNNTNVQCSLPALQCSFSGVLYPYEEITVSIGVEVKAPAGTLSDSVSVRGGGAAESTRVLKVPVSSEPAGFGVAGYELSPFNANGTPATQAGKHPFQLTTTLSLNETSERNPAKMPKDLTFRLPSGLVGNPNAATQCTMADFFALVEETDLCPPSSAVGVATVTAHEPKTGVITQTVPVFNLVPAQGEPARLGFEVIGKIPIVIDTSVRSGQDYGVNATVENATEVAGVTWSQVTLWGVPGDRRHDSARGWECVAGGAFEKQSKKTCPAIGKEAEEPFLTLPSSCAVNPEAEPIFLSMQADSWANPGRFLGAEYQWMNESGQSLGFEGCNELLFSPAIDVTSEESSASTPTGVTVDVSIPQEGLMESQGRSQADVRDTTVTLPRGVDLSPSAANGLAACPESPEDGYEGIGFTGFQKFNGPGLEPSAETATFTPTFRLKAVEVAGDKLPPSCPEASKLGVVHIKTPLLSHELEGAVYLASPAPNGEAGRNPFNSLVALYIVAEDPVSGVLVKLAGEGHVDEETLQISTTFKNAPPVPFEDLKLELFGGPRASVTTPPACGFYPTSATFVPWSTPQEASEISPAQDFAITSGVGGSACPAGGLGFAPGFTAYSRSTQAGAFTGFTMELSRPDGDQALNGVSMHLPSGVAALLSSVELCSQAQAVTDSCPPGSEVGEATAIAGLGSEPYVQRGGRVYITERYGNAPFGLVIVTPAQAGPFDLGYVTVRSKLYVDQTNASVTIVSDPLPTQIRGIPLQLKRVIVSVNRPGFEFNPTSCEPMSITGTISGAEHAAASVSSPFKAENCGSLPFNPQLTASAVGHGSKAEGTTFAVTVRSGGVNASGVAQAGIAKVQLQLPKQLSSRMPTLQKACVDAVFNANPASCDEGSVIGYATIHTPVLKSPLTGPAYLVSHGGAAFPDVEFLLQGEGIELILDGKTDIKGELTYSKFESTPDAPFTTFETVLPASPHGVLTPNVPEAKRFSLCGETLEMPTTIIAQNGKRVEQETNVTLTGCEKEKTEVKGAKTKHTLKQQLQHALYTCRHKHRHSKSKRAKCEHKARTHYTRLALNVCRHQHKHAKHKRQACERAARKHYSASSARHIDHSRSSKGQGARA